MHRHTSKVSHEVLEKYSEVIDDTMYDLNVQLQRINEKIGSSTVGSTDTSDTNIDLMDEQAVTQQCLRICEQARCYFDSLTTGEPSLKHEAAAVHAADGPHHFEAQMLTRKLVDESREKFSETIGRLQGRLETLSLEGGHDSERARLQEEIDHNKRNLAICKTAADEVYRQKVFRVGESVAEGDSDLVVITTLADLFDVGKIRSMGNSAHLIGSMTDESLRQVSRDRYGSRFGSLASSGTDNTASHATSDTRRTGSYTPHQAGEDKSSNDTTTRRTKPAPNEVRKRTTEV